MKDGMKYESNSTPLRSPLPPPPRQSINTRLAINTRFTRNETLVTNERVV
jgi:hypothetical protein